MSQGLMRLPMGVCCVSMLCMVLSDGHASQMEAYISGGGTFQSLGNSEYVPLNSYIVNAYKADQKTHWTGVWGVGVGHTFEAVRGVKQLDVSLGVAGYMVSLGQVKGTEYPFANAGLYDTLNYQFNTKSNAIMFESRWAYAVYDWKPFALVGIGKAWNRLSSYLEVPTDPALTAAPVPFPFGDATHQSFAYELGLGVQRHLFDDEQNHLHYSWSLDYRYVNFGRGELSPMPAQTTSSRLHINNMYTQGIVLSLKALCG